LLLKVKESKQAEKKDIALKIAKDKIRSIKRSRLKGT
jgi:hypothetical protein